MLLPRGYEPVLYNIENIDMRIFYDSIDCKLHLGGSSMRNSCTALLGRKTDAEMQIKKSETLLRNRAGTYWSIATYY